MRALILLLLAADLSRYPSMATATLPKGPGLLPLPPELVGAWGDDLDRSMLLLDSAGEPVPYTVLRNEGWMEEDRRFATARPVGAGEWQTGSFDMPVGALELRVREEAFVARAWVGQMNGESWLWQERGLVWRVEGGTSNLRLPVLSGFGPYRVRLEPLRGSAPSLTGVEGLRVRAAGAEMLVEDIDMPAPEINEEGFARYRIALPGPREIRSVELTVEDDDIFSRRVRLYGDPSSMEREATITRVRIDSGADSPGPRVNLDDTAVRGVRIQGRSLIVDVETERGEPLKIPRVRIYSTGVVVLAERDVATIYAGTLEPEGAYDIKIAAQELLRGTAWSGSVGAATPNPAWVPPPTREGVDGPGAVLYPVPQKWQRRIIASPGWVRVPLGPEVLAHAARSLADLRVIDKDGREIPFIRQSWSAETAPEEATFSQAEDGTTLVRVQNRLPLSAVGRMVIEVEPATFVRSVELLQDRGLATQTLRSRTWASEQQGHRLALDLDADLGAEVTLRIRNEGNPPLKIKRITLTRPASELLVCVPEGGARLLYGSEKADAAWYDLSILRAQVLRMPVADATLAAEEPVSGEAASTDVDKGAAAVALGILAVGLVGMTLRLLWSQTPEEEPPAG